MGNGRRNEDQTFPPSMILCIIITTTTMELMILTAFYVFYGTWRIIPVFTWPCHLSLSWARWVQSTYTFPSHLVTLTSYGEELSAPYPTPPPPTGGPPTVGCPRLLIQYVHSHPPSLEAAPCIHNVWTCHSIVMDPLNTDDPNTWVNSE